MPPVSRFGGGARTKKKQAVIDKLKIFFEKYFGIGASASFTGRIDEPVVYSIDSQKQQSMVAESSYEPPAAYSFSVMALTALMMMRSCNSS